MAGLDSNVKLLLHCNGADGSTSFPDSSNDNLTVTRYGDAQVDTAQSKFGGASALFDGTSDYLSVPDSAEWAFGTSPFTIDLWMRFNVVDGTAHQIMSQGDRVPTDNTWKLSWTGTGSNRLSFSITTGGTGQLSFRRSFTPSTGIWYHIAVVRINSDNAATAWRMFIDGVAATLTKDSGNWNASVGDYAGPLQVGGLIESTASVNGWMDEVRISNVARWTSDFSVPTEEYSLDALILDESEAISLSDTFELQTNPDNQNNSDTMSLSDSWDLITSLEPLGLSDSLSLHDDWVTQITPDNQSITDGLSLDDSWQALVNPEQQITSDSFSLSDSFSFSKIFYQLLNTDLRWHVRILSGITTSLNWLLAKMINTDLRWLGIAKTTINTDLRWLTNPYSILSPITPLDIQIFVNGVDLLLGNDINVQSGNITHVVGQKSIASFVLARKHDDLDRTHGGVASEISNQNAIQIYIKGYLEFDGFISSLNAHSESETIAITALMDEPISNRHSIELPLPSINEKLHLYHCLVNAVQIDNPKESTSVVIVGSTGRYWNGSAWVISVDTALSFTTDIAAQNYIDSYVDNSVNKTFESKSPSVTTEAKNIQYYKGVKVNLGTRIQQQISKYRDLENIYSTYDIVLDGKTYNFKDTGLYAAQLTVGTFVSLPNYNYFWAVCAKNLRDGKTITNGDYRYIGTSLGSLSSDLWVLSGVSPIRQKISENIETELGYYYVGSAPYKEISTKNGQLITVEKWQDRNDGLYNVYDQSYNYISYAQQVANLEYQKLLNVHGDILPITSANLDITFDAYYYYTVKLLTRINVTNTTVSNSYNNLNGFPTSVKSININFSTMKVTLNTDNKLSQVEIDEIDAQMPNEDDYLVKEKATRVYRKFDLSTWAYVS